MTTTLIFASMNDASPLIHLTADVDEVRRHLSERPPQTWLGPGFAAALFLRGLSPDQFDEWVPTLESVPAMSIADAKDELWADILWNTETWAEVPAPDPDEEGLTEEERDAVLAADPNWNPGVGFVP